MLSFDARADNIYFYIVLKQTYMGKIAEARIFFMMPIISEAKLTPNQIRDAKNILITQLIWRWRRRPNSSCSAQLRDHMNGQWARSRPGRSPGVGRGSGAER